MKASYLCIILTVIILGEPMTRAEKAVDQFIVVDQKGHLSCGGERVRFWGVIGNFPNQAGISKEDTPEVRREKTAKAYADAEAFVERFGQLGFNLCRTFRGSYTAPDYTPGDGSNADVIDYFLFRMKQKGSRVWCAALNNVGEIRPEDADIVADPATREAWQEAVRQGRLANKDKWELRNTLARIWDPRLEALGLERMCKIATHLNKHSGVRWCDDPLFAVWELSNEEWWIRRMVAGGWRKLPEFFQRSLLKKWNEYLARNYETDEKLRLAWEKLLPGESIRTGTVQLLPLASPAAGTPLLNDANEAARRAVEASGAQYGRSDFASARGSDVLAFLLDLQLQHKQREAAAIKALGKSTAASPMIFDTGIGYEIQSQFLHQQADAVAHDAYVNGVGEILEGHNSGEPASKLARMQQTLQQERMRPNAGPWINWLLKPPGIAHGVPWLEHNRVEGKPYFAYETQIQQPAKYRADFPLRIAALASIQDWDVVCWHYFGPVPNLREERPFDQPMDITTSKHPQGYHYTFDEVQNAMMLAAGRMFREQLLEPAKNPTLFIYGRKSLLDPATMDYGGSYGIPGMDMLQTTYQYGTRILIDPHREEDEIRGPVVTFQERSTFNPYTPTPQITMDWKKGYVRCDGPGVAAFAGLMARYGSSVDFSSGVSLKEIRVHNPEGSFDPVREDEGYVAFALYSTDGKALSDCSSAAFSMVSTSYNSGFALGSGPKAERQGGLPVLVCRVSGQLAVPMLDGMRFRMKDWHFRTVEEGIVQAGTLVVPENLPVFVVEFER